MLLKGYDSVRKDRGMDAPIPFEVKEGKPVKRDEYTKFALRSVPADANSETHDKQVQHFKNGTPERTLKFLADLDEVIIGQNLTTGPAKYSVTKTLLKGEAARVFAQHAGKEETDENFAAGLTGLKRHFFPARAIPKQKRYLRRYLRKARDTPARGFTGRLIEINELLAKFPGGDAATPLATDEINEIIEFATPKKWQRQMAVHGFNPDEKETHEVVDFCERLEVAESFEDVGRAPTKPRADANRADGRSPKRKAKSGLEEYPEGASAKRQHVEPCPIHGAGHSMQDCKILMAHAESVRKTVPYAGRRNGYNGNNKKKARGGKRPGGYKHKKYVKSYSTAEVNAMLAKERAKRKRRDEDNFAVEEFEELSLDDHADDADDRKMAADEEDPEEEFEEDDIEYYDAEEEEYEMVEDPRVPSAAGAVSEDDSD